MKRFVLFLYLFFLIKGMDLYSTIYYIDFEKGDDKNSGITSDEPWKHCPFDKNATDKARSTKIKAGDILLFKGGVVYYGCIEIDGRFIYGEENKPIILKGDGWGDGKAIIDGSELIEGEWKKCTSPDEVKGNPNWEKIYCIQLKKSYSFTQGFYEDDDFLWYSQEPNPSDPFFYDRIDNFRVIPKGDSNIKQTRTSITDPRYFTQKDPDFWKGSYVALWRVPNVTVIKKITGYDPQTSTIFHEDAGGDLYADRNSYYSIINHVSLIDKPGEFALDEEKKVLYIWPKDDDIKKHKYKIRVENVGIKADGVKNIVIEGFIIQNFTMGIRLYRSSDNMPVPENFIIRNNEVRNLKADEWYSIHIGGKNGIVENNKVINSLRGVGILAGGENIIVRKNYVKRTSRQGIWFMGAKDSIIENNFVESCKGTHANGISVYSNSENITVRNNLVIDSNIPFTMEQSKDLKIYNNIFDGEKKVGYVIAGWFGLKGTIYILNNNISGSTSGYLHISGDCKIIFKNNITDGILGNCERSYNIYTTEKAKTLNLAEGEKIETDLKKIFVNPEKKDYQLKENSPAIDSGMDLSEIFTTDMDGIKRPKGKKWDIGPYEFKEVEK
ncbi:MAG: right-handed parallel beta-helix repeat-containing protein [bacterium]|nr:right-handed parallel beta-helix repeat-containing protein [bacterium]MDW8164663.1 right-handed parallel beta-helix repeat-containing protein [Candidatus Omnitrophota bacterium]